MSLTSKLIIFPPKTLRHSPYLQLSNSCYQMWHRNWSQIYRERKLEGAFKLDDFYRQDHIGAIFIGDRVAGLWMNSTFNIHTEASRAHHYFKFFDQDYLNWLEQHSIEDVMSLEFLTTAPELRSSRLGFSLGRVMVALSCKILQTSHAQALVAAARTDVAAAHVGYELGFECVKADTVQRTFPCDLIACRKSEIRMSPDPKVCEFVKRLWEERKDYREMKHLALETIGAA